MSENQLHTEAYNTKDQLNTPAPPPPPHFNPQPSNSHIWVGAFLLLVGAIFLLKRLGIELPDFLISWQMILIAIGIFVGVRKDFQGASWLVLILIGSLFLINEFFVFGELRRFILPIILIGAGLFFIFRPKKSYNYVAYDASGEPADIPLTKGVHPTSEDYLDATSIFGGTKKKVFSKAFKGGEMVNIFGGSEIDLTQADISGTVVLEVTTLFGGATLLVPSNWNVVSNAVAILGEVKDKRVMTNIPENSNKTLVIKGTVIFGGVDVKSF